MLAWALLVHCRAFRRTGRLGKPYRLQQILHRQLKMYLVLLHSCVTRNHQRHRNGKKLKSNESKNTRLGSYGDGLPVQLSRRKEPGAT